MTRDLTHRQFQAAIEREGITPALGGYYRVADRLLVCAANGGKRRRSQLAYLIRERDKWLSQLENETRLKSVCSCE